MQQLGQVLQMIGLLLGMGDMRYLVFAGSYHYPNGGMHDWVASCESLEEAKNIVRFLSVKSYDWYHIFDLGGMEIADQGSI